MNLQAFVSNAVEIFDTLFQRENLEKVEDIRDHLRASIELTLDIFRDVLDREGVRIPQSRSLYKSILREEFEKELVQRMTIIPFSFEDEEEDVA